MAPPAQARARRKAGLTLTGIVVAALVLLGAVVAVVIARNVTAPPTPATTSSTMPPAAPAPGFTTDTGAAEEVALAAAPMLQLPVQSAQPQSLTTATAGPPISVPEPKTTAGRWIPGGFPDTPEGAVGQLIALNETALAAADPQVYARGYREIAEAGAPDPAATGLATLLRSMRARAHLPPAGPIPELTASYQVTHAQIKGTAAGGRYVVVCVLGQFSATANGQVAALGIGDCQAMRWTGSQWRIASGPLAAAAPCAWPGSADAVKAGYREVV